MNARALLGRGMFVVVLGLLGLTSCLPAPLGDPSESKADSRFSGVWEWRDGRTHQAIIRPWDEKTFLVDVLTGEPQADGSTKPRERNIYKAWLTDVKGQTFITMQPVELTGAMNGDARQPYYLIAKVKLDGTTLTATALEPDFKKLKDVTTRAALEKIVSENLDDPKLFNPGPITATRWTVEQMKGLDKLQETFQGWK